MLQADIVEEVVMSISHDRAGTINESRDNKGTYTTVVPVGEKDEVIFVEAVRKSVGQTVLNESMIHRRSKLLLSRRRCIFFRTT